MADPLPLSREAAQPVSRGDTPWIPIGPGQAFRPIRFLPGARGYVAQLRLEPGSVIPPHRHTGEVHAFNLEGERRLHTGEVVGPGDYVYEPAGNVDTWEAIGTTPTVVLIVVEGDVEYLATDGQVAIRYNAEVMEAAYRSYCEQNAIEVRELTS